MGGPQIGRVRQKITVAQEGTAVAVEQLLADANAQGQYCDIRSARLNRLERIQFGRDFFAVMRIKACALFKSAIKRVLNAMTGSYRLSASFCTKWVTSLSSQRAAARRLVPNFSGELSSPVATKL